MSENQGIDESLYYGVTLGPYPIPKPNDFTLIMSDNEELI